MVSDDNVGVKMMPLSVAMHSDEIVSTVHPVCEHLSDVADPLGVFGTVHIELVRAEGENVGIGLHLSTASVVVSLSHSYELTRVSTPVCHGYGKRRRPVLLGSSTLSALLA